MLLSKLIEGITWAESRNFEDREITGVSFDTRTIRPGEIFVALPGYKTDGRLYVDQAVARGAAAVVSDRAPAAALPWLRAEEPRSALAALSANWFGHPARALRVIGVTGTNGKTTTTYLLKEMLEQVTGERVGLIGTNQVLIADTAFTAERTTPESWEVQKLFRDMAEAGCTWAVMEVSSHALALHRVDGVDFTAGIFTNLTPEHLDFHGTMEEYRRAKGLLFDRCGVAVLNLDDEAGRYYARHVTCRQVTYSENKDEADMTGKNLRLFPDRVEFEAVTVGAIARVRLPIPGGFSIYNALACLSCGMALGLPLGEMCQSLARVKGVRGRVEVVAVSAPYTVVIDYAHTPDALEKILVTARDFTAGRLICLFGCGGDRDRSKRPVMGDIAAGLADVVVVTSDNPRSEEPMAIIGEILSGMEGTKTPCLVEPDRRKAIRLALSEGQAGDVIVLAGKGHETYQEAEGVRRHLDEREEIAAFFREREEKL